MINSVCYESMYVLPLACSLCWGGWAQVERKGARVERKGVMHYRLPYSQQETKVIK